jgi:hypothetical protein
MPDEVKEEKDLSIKVGEDGRVIYGKDLKVQEKLVYIQAHLKAKKAQVNTFGGFNYRSCEDIVEALKPLLGDLVLLMNDELVLIGDRYYVKAKVEIIDRKGNSYNSVAYAREALSKTKMDDAQVTGGASSYARKYALNGLLAIDDSDSDPDRLDNSKKEIKSPIIKGSDGRGVIDPDGRMVKLDKDPDWIKGQTTTKILTSGACELCGAVGRYHRKDCPNG